MDSLLKGSFTDFECYTENVLFRIVILFMLRHTMIKIFKSDLY